uniref:DUF659 domain-containing protein n=1 Tax=Oryza brachyantha TaxID=4533 RepID=J3ME57_ORYBR
MDAYLKKNARTVFVDMAEQGGEDADEEGQTIEPQPEPSSGTKVKQAKKKIAQSAITLVVSAAVKPQTQKYLKAVNSMLCKTPEEVVAERHKSKTSQPTLEHCTKKDKEVKQIVDDHVTDFLESDIPLNVINSRSWEIMLESIGQYGPGYRSPSYHAMRNPLLERGVDRTTLRKKHEEAWKEYGCTIMSNGWTDTSHRHLINFLANSPTGTFFLCSVDASSEVASAQMLADLFEKQIDKVGKEHDIGKINEFKSCINSTMKVFRFIYKHGRLLSLMKEKIGGDLVRLPVTRFATSFLTLASMLNELRNLFVSEECISYSTSSEGKKALDTILSMPFWKMVEN